MPQKKQQPKNFAKNKKAFDVVMRHLRDLGRPQIGGVGAVNPAQGGGKPAPRNPAKPTPVDFRCDVFMAIGAACPKDIDLVQFFLAYVLGEADQEDDIAREMHAQKLLHDRRHSVEQRLGAEFIRRGLFPVQGKGYFFSPRVWRER